ncbi:hypothetical protein GCM10027596_40950 [Nocardioides korecus]
MTSSQGPIQVRKLLRLTGLVLVLMGVLGTHGLACSGSASATGMDMSMSLSMSSPTTPASVPALGQTLANAADGLAHAAGVGRTVLTSAEGVSGGDSDMGMSMAGLCVTILLIGMTGFFFLLNRCPGLMALSSAPRLVAVPRPSGRGSDPPSLTALSVQRC